MSRSTPSVTRLSRAPLFVAAMLVVGGCTPSLAPLYGDFRYVAPDSAEEAAGADRPPTELLVEEIREGVLEAGWTLAESPAPNVIATEPKTVSRWGLYRVEVYIEVSPISGHYVRVLVHPYRVYFTGHRSKMPFLKGSIRRAVFPDLRRAFEPRGIIDVGNARERDGID